MKSFGIYYHTEAKDVTESIDIGELHVNIWKVYESRQLTLHPIFYLDFGIRTNFKVDKVNLYIPFKADLANAVLSDPDAFDLAGKMMSNKNLLCAIFNSEMRLEHCENGCFCKVENLSNRDSFYLYRLSSCNVETCHDVFGSYFTLSFEGSPFAQKEQDIQEQRYVRIRLKVEDNSQFIISEHISNDLFQDAFTQMDLFDLRFNELRAIDAKVQENMHKLGFERMRFDKIHIFYVADIQEIVENRSALEMDSRIVEKELWSDYKPNNSLENTHYIAHHWSIENNKCDNDNSKEQINTTSKVSIFFTTQYPKLDWHRLIAYLAVIVLLGWLGSYLTFNGISSSWPITLDTAKSILVVVLFLYIIVFAFQENIGVRPFRFFRKR